MGKHCLTTTAILVFFSLSMAAYDVVQINNDKKTLEQLTINTAAQVATNDLHNRQVDSIKKKQTKLLEAVSAIAAEKELIIQTYKNVSGFKKESKYYVTIAKTGLDILKHSEEAIDAIEKSKLAAKAMATVKVADLIMQATSLGKAFADIVADCEVPNPLNQTETSHKDKLNLLNRHERLYMANDILMRLRSIDNAIRLVTYYAMTSNWKNLLFHLDRKTFTTYIMTQVNTDDMIRKWERVKK